MLKPFDFRKLRSIASYRLLVIVVSLLLIIVLGISFFPTEQLDPIQTEGTQAFRTSLAELPRIGQTFVARQAGLQAVYLPAQVDLPLNNAILTLHLTTDPLATTDIRRSTVILAELANTDLLPFTFDPLPDSAQQRYYFWLEASASQTEIQFMYGEPTSYINGALYLNDQPQSAQSRFWLAYDRRLMVLDWLYWLGMQLPTMLILILLTLLPGGAFLIWLLPLTEKGQELDLIESLALAAALSFACYPLLFLWANFISWPLTTLNLSLILACCALIFGMGVYQRRAKKTLPFIIEQPTTPPLFLFWLIFLMSAATRIWVSRGQVVPLWQDAYHHTLISQLLIDHGGLFRSWQPYAPLESLSYHFGFHSLVAVYHWLSATETPIAVMTMGQWLNLLSVPLAYLLGRRLGGSDWAGVFAALITGLISQYPFFYFNWSRFTQLAGQTQLPALLILTWWLLTAKKQPLGLLILAAISLAGLTLTHYRVVLFYPGFVLSLLVGRWLMLDPRQTFRNLLLLASSAALLTAPWIIRVVGGRLWQVNQAMMSSEFQQSEYMHHVLNTNLNIFDYILPALVIFALLGALWGCWQRRLGIFVVSGWVIYLLIAGNPHYLGVRGSTIITYFTVLIALYLPFSVLIGYLLGEVMQFLEQYWSRIGWAAVILVALFSPHFIYQQIDRYQPENGMVTRPDLAALAWVRNTLSETATFWSNARIAYGGTAVVGTDGGWWIPYFGGRRHIVPPMIYGTEISSSPNYPIQLVEWYNQFVRQEPASMAGWEALRAVGVSHVYVAQRRGTIWQAPEQQLLDPLTLNDSPFYRAIYHEDLVWIFELVDNGETTP